MCAFCFGVFLFGFLFRFALFWERERKNDVGGIEDWEALGPHCKVCCYSKTKETNTFNISCTEKVTWTSLHPPDRGEHSSDEDKGQVHVPSGRNLVCQLTSGYLSYCNWYLVSMFYLTIAFLYCTGPGHPPHFHLGWSLRLPFIRACQSLSMLSLCGSPFCLTNCTALSCLCCLYSAVARQFDGNVEIWKKNILWRKRKSFGLIKTLKNNWIGTGS